MPRFTQEQLNEQFKRLPPALKDALFSAEVADKILTIGRKYTLNIEKTGFLAEETGYIILGLSRADEFVRMLAERIGISRMAASEIAKEINREILTPIREELRRAHAIQITDIDLEKAGEILPHKHPGEIARPQPIPQRHPPVVPTPVRSLSAAVPRAPQPSSPQTPPQKPAAPPIHTVIQPPTVTPMVGETKQAPRITSKIPPIDLRGSRPPLAPLPTPTPPREATPVPKPISPVVKDHLDNDPYREPMG